MKQTDLDLIERAVRDHALPHPATAEWAERWLSGEDRSGASAASAVAARAAAAAAAARAAAAATKAWAELALSAAAADAGCGADGAEVGIASDCQYIALGRTDIDGDPVFRFLSAGNDGKSYLVQDFVYQWREGERLKSL